VSGVRYTDSPSAALPGEIVGAPVRIPAILCCQAAPAGRRWCGKTWVANTEKQFAEKAAERREHEATCQGGLIVTGG
jgi:hypothetical protein